MTHRHYFSVARISAVDRIEGWTVYRELFDELLDDENVSSSMAPFYLLPDWVFDILHEFVYQFQGFRQFRASVHSSARKHKVDVNDPSSSAPHNLLENLAVLANNTDAWAVESVMQYLTRLMDVGTSSTVPAYQYLGIFASVALSRLECLMGDYTSCLDSGRAVMSESSGISVTVDGETLPSNEIVQSVFGARLSWAYHAGVAYLMLRRYKDAIRTLGGICSYMQRGFKVRSMSVLPHLVHLQSHLIFVSVYGCFAQVLTLNDVLIPFPPGFRFGSSRWTASLLAISDRAVPQPSRL